MAHETESNLDSGEQPRTIPIESVEPESLVSGTLRPLETLTDDQQAELAKWVLNPNLGNLITTFTSLSLKQQQEMMTVISDPRFWRYWSQPNSLVRTKVLGDVFSEDSLLADPTPDKISSYTQIIERLEDLNRRNSEDFGTKLSMWGTKTRKWSIEKPNNLLTIAARVAAATAIVTWGAIAVDEFSQTGKSLSAIPARVQDVVNASVVVEPSKIQVAELVPKIDFDPRRGFDAVRIIPPNPTRAFEPMLASRQIKVDATMNMLEVQYELTLEHFKRATIGLLATLFTLVLTQPVKRFRESSNLAGPIVGRGIDFIGSWIYRFNNT